MSKSRITREHLEQVSHLSASKAAAALTVKLGSHVGKSTVIDARARLDMRRTTKMPEFDPGSDSRFNISQAMDSSLTVESIGKDPQSRDAVIEKMRMKGFDPDEYSFSFRFSEWEAQSPDGVITMYATRASATPKPEVANQEALNVDELIDTIGKWQFTPIITNNFTSADIVTQFADPQLGKTDLNGGTEETVSQIMNSFAEVAELAKETRPRAINLADLGDGLENFYNTSSQRETNDLDLTSQVRLLRRLQAEGIRMLAPLCETLIHSSIPSNHGSVRIGPQMQASTASNDWGLEVSHQLEDVFSESQFDNLKFIRPSGTHEVSVGFKLPSGTRMGQTHGDQAGTQQKVAQWWMSQAFGWDNPLREADILMVGHFHNQAVEEVFEGRFIIFGAASDRGSAWFTNRTGRSASSGMTTFLTHDGKFDSLQLL